MNFAPFHAHTTPLFESCNILKFANIINVESCIFINSCFNKDSFSVFNENFKLVSTMLSYNARSASNGLLFVRSYNSVGFGRKSIINSTSLIWNYLQDRLTKYNFQSLTPRSLEILYIERDRESIYIERDRERQRQRETETENLLYVIYPYANSYVINFLFSRFLFLLTCFSLHFFHHSLLQSLVSCYLFLFTFYFCFLKD